MISPSVAAVATTSTAVASAKHATQHEAVTRALQARLKLGGSFLLVRINCALAARSPAGGAARPELNKKSCPEHIARLMEAVSKLWSGYMCMLME